MAPPRQRRTISDKTPPRSGSSRNNRDPSGEISSTVAVVVVSLALVCGGVLYTVLQSDHLQPGSPRDGKQGDDRMGTAEPAASHPSPPPSHESSSRTVADDISKHRAPSTESPDRERKDDVGSNVKQQKTERSESVPAQQDVKAEGDHETSREQKNMVLASGHTMPWLGLGTRRLIGSRGMETIRTAIHSGYRMFDTAVLEAEFDEDALGRAIIKTGIPRGNIFIIIKLSIRDRDQFESQLESSLGKLRTAYVDLLLLELTNVSKVILQDAWRKIEALAIRSKARSIGLSNTSLGELTDVVQYTTVPVSAVQNTFNPFQQDKKVRSFCKEKRIVYVGRQTLGGSWLASGTLEKNPVLTNEIVTALAQLQKASAAQLVLQWAMNEGVVVLPGSVNEQHIRENILSMKMPVHKDVLGPLDHFDGIMESFSSARRKPAPRPCMAKKKTVSDEDMIDEILPDEAEDRNIEGKNKEEEEEDAEDEEGEEDLDLYAGDLNKEDIDKIPEGEFPSLESLKQWAQESQWGKIGTATVRRTVETGDAILLVCVNKQGKRSGRLVAVNRADGAEMWSFNVNDHLRALPAVSEDGQTLYLGTIDWHVYALHMRNGSIIWEHKSTDSFIVTPLLHNNKLYIGNMAGKMFCLHAHTGKAIWESSISEFGFAGTPLYHRSKNDELLFVPTLDMEWSNMFVLRAKTGEVLHDVELSGSVTYSPFFSLDKTVMYAAGAGLVFDSARVHALKVGRKANPVWSTNTGSLDEYAPSMVLSRDGKELYIVHSSGAFIVIDARTGRKVHKQSLGRGPVASGPLIDKDSNILLVSGDRHLYIINRRDTSRKMERARKVNVGLEVWATPALDKDRSLIYCGTKDGVLSVFDYVNLRHVWTVNLNGTIRAPVLLL